MNKYSFRLLIAFPIFLLLSLIFLSINGVLRLDQEANIVQSTEELQTLSTKESTRKEEGTTCGTQELINSMRLNQTMATANWAHIYQRLQDRWRVMADYFRPLIKDLKYNFRSFSYLADDEFKHWLEMKDRKAPCNMITIGVGEVWDGERLIQNKYPQCRLMGIDPSATINRKLVEAVPNSRFIHAAVSDQATNVTIYGKDEGEYTYYQGQTENFIDLMERENGQTLVDFLSIDAEGAEFGLLPLLHNKRDRLPVTCQVNVELHYKQENYGHSMEDFMETLRSFMADAHYVLMDIDIYDYLPAEIMMRRLFFVNVVDDECVRKYLC